MKKIAAAAPSAALVSGAVSPVAAQVRGPLGADRTEPKVFVRDDGRHGAGTDQFEPPLDRSDITVIVDQLIGSGADALLFSAGVEGGTVIYDSRVAQKLGDNVTRWTHAVHYRDARHVRQMIADGHDRIRMLCDRCHEHGIWFFPSLQVDIGTYISERGHGRTSDFVFDNPRLQVGKDEDPRAKDLLPTRLNFLHPEVRRERFLIFEELLARYESDGIELFFDSPPPCKLSQVGEFAPALTQWIRDLREVARKAAQTQGRRKRILFYLQARSAAWMIMGYQVDRWVSEGLVDGLICGGGVPEKMDQDLDLSHVVALTRNSPCRVIAACASGIDRQLAKKATQPMIWAAAANAYSQGADGINLDDAHWFSWPWKAGVYETLRLLRDPKLLATADKIYRVRSLPPGGQSGLIPDDGPALPRKLPEGTPVTVILRVADDLEQAQSLGRVESVRLRVRVTNIDASLNQVNVELNGRLLPRELLHPNDLTYRILDGGAVRPYGYIFSYELTPEHFPKPGHNRIQVTLVRRDPNIDVPFELFDVDCCIRFRRHRSFEREPLEY
ncbi:MAG: hypothetical protein ACKV22_02950 [Bryobacteraceae bacterium]